MEKFDKIQKYPNEIVFSEQKKIGALTKDIFAVAVMQLEEEYSKNLDLFNNVTVTIKRKLINSIDANTSRFKIAIRELSDFTIIFDNGGKTMDTLEYTVIKPFISVGYSTKRKELDLLIYSKIAKSFLDLKRDFSQIYIKDVLSLSSFRSKRFYEIMVGVKNFSLDCKRTFSDEELKKILQTKTNYTIRHKQFEERIIITSIEEINAKTGIFVSYERNKIDKGEYSTLFTVVDKHKEIQAHTHELTIPLPEIIGMTRARFDNIVKGMQEWGISRVHMATIFNDAHLLKNYTKWRFAYLQKSTEDKAKIKSPSAVVLAHLGLTESKNSKKYLEALAAREKNGGAIK